MLALPNETEQAVVWNVPAFLISCSDRLNAESDRSLGSYFLFLFINECYCNMLEFFRTEAPPPDTGRIVSERRALI